MELLFLPAKKEMEEPQLWESGELLVHIFSFLDVKGLCNATQVNHSWHTLIDGERELWKRLFLSTLEVEWHRSPSDAFVNWEQLLKHIVWKMKTHTGRAKLEFPYGYGYIAGTACAALSWVTSATSPFLSPSVKESIIKFILRFPKCMFYKAKESFLLDVEKSIKDAHSRPGQSTFGQRTSDRVELPVWFKELSKVFVFVNPFDPSVGLTLDEDTELDDTEPCHMLMANFVFTWMIPLSTTVANNALLLNVLSGEGDVSSGAYCSGRDHAWGLAVDEKLDENDGKCGTLYEWCWESGYHNRWPVLNDYPQFYQWITTLKTSFELLDRVKQHKFECEFDFSFLFKIGDGQKQTLRHKTTCTLFLNTDTLKLDGKFEVKELDPAYNIEAQLEGSITGKGEVNISCRIGQDKLCTFIGTLEFGIRGRKVLLGAIKCHSVKGEGLVVETQGLTIEVAEGYLTAYSLPPPPPTTDEKIINLAKSQFALVGGYNDPFHVLSHLTKNLPETDVLIPIVESLQKTHGKSWEEFSHLGPVLLLIAWVRLRSVIIYIFQKEDKEAIENREKLSLKKRKKMADKGLPSGPQLRSREEKNQQIMEELPAWLELLEFCRKQELAGPVHEGENQEKWTEWNYWGWMADAPWPHPWLPKGYVFPYAMLLFSNLKSFREIFSFIDKQTMTNVNAKSYFQQVEAIFENNPDPVEKDLPEFARQLIMPYRCLSYRLNTFDYVCGFSITAAEHSTKQAKYLMNKLLSLTKEAETTNPTLAALIDCILIQACNHYEKLSSRIRKILKERGPRVLPQAQMLLVHDKAYMLESALYVLKDQPHPSSIPALKHCLLYVCYDSAKVWEVLRLCEAVASTQKLEPELKDSELDEILAEDFKKNYEKLDTTIDRTKQPHGEQGLVLVPEQYLNYGIPQVPLLKWKDSQVPLSKDAMNWVFAILMNHMGEYRTMSPDVYAKVRQLKAKLDPIASNEFATTLVQTTNLQQSDAWENGVLGIFADETLIDKFLSPDVSDHLGLLRTNTFHKLKLHGSDTALYGWLKLSGFKIQEVATSTSTGWLAEEAKNRGLSASTFIDEMIGKHFRFTQSEKMKEEDKIVLLDRLHGAMKGRKIGVKRFITNFALNIADSVSRVLLALHSNSNTVPVLCVAVLDDRNLVLRDINKKVVASFPSEEKGKEKEKEKEASEKEKEKEDEEKGQEGYITVVHPLQLSETEVKEWKNYFESEKLLPQPFEQLNHDVYRLPEELSTSDLPQLETLRIMWNNLKLSIIVMREHLDQGVKKLNIPVLEFQEDYSLLIGDTKIGMTFKDFWDGPAVVKSIKVEEDEKPIEFMSDVVLSEYLALYHYVKENAQKEK